MRVERSSFVVIVAIVVAIVLATYTVFALSQPGMPPGPGMGDPSAIFLSDQLHQTLGLNTMQETQWQQLKQDGVAVFNQLRASRQNLRMLIDEELAKPNPDLNLIETAVENAHSTDDAALKALRLEALAFYSILTADQQALVINALQQQQLQRDKRLPPQGKDQSVVIQLGQTI